MKRTFALITLAVFAAAFQNCGDSAFRPALESTNSSTGGENDDPGPNGPASPTTCNYNSAIRDLSLQPLERLPSIVMPLRDISDNRVYPFVSTNGGLTFPTRRATPFDLSAGCSNDGENNKGQFYYLCQNGVPGANRGSGLRYHLSNDYGLTYQTGIDIPGEFYMPYWRTSTYLDTDNSLFVTGARYIQELSFQLAPNSSYGYSSRSWLTRVIRNGQTIDLENFLPAGYHGAESMSVVKTPSGVLYASGFFQRVSVVNGRGMISTELVVRRSTNGGAAWSTVLTTPLGELKGWNNPDLIATPDNKVLLFFMYTVEPNPSVSINYHGVFDAQANTFLNLTPSLGNNILRNVSAIRGDKVAFLLNRRLSDGTYDARNRIITILDMRTLTQKNFDFAYKAFTGTGFDTLRFLESGDLVLSGWGQDQGPPVVRESFKIAVPCN